MGAIAALCTIFPRLVVQKKNVVYGDEAVKELKDRSYFSPMRILVANINSINGFAGLMLLVAIIFNLVNILVICYFVIQLVFFSGAMYVTLKKM